jgi:hypothetical protein
MKSIKALYVFAISILMTSCAATIKVTHLPKVPPAPTKVNNGIYYALPLTVVKAEVPVERNWKEPAPFKEYALIFFPELAKREFKAGGTHSWKSDVVEKSEMTYSVKDPLLSTFGEPDPDQIYFVEIQDNKRLDQAITLTWTDRGAVTGAKASVDNTTGDMIMSGISLAAGIASRTAFGTLTSAPDKKRVCAVSPQAGDTDVIDALIDKSGEVDPALTGNYCGLPAELRKPIIQNVQKDKGAALKSAIAVYDEQLKDLVAAKMSVIKGTHSVADLSASLRELGVSITALRDKYFRGIEEKVTWTGVFEVRPNLAAAGKLSVANGSLLRLHKNNGVHAIGVLAAGSKPMPAEWQLSNGGEAASGEEIAIDFSQFTTDRNGQLAGIVDKYSGNNSGERSFFYRIPATSVTKLMQGTKTLLEAQQTIGQLGALRSLPASNSSRGIAYDLAFIETTGALRSLGLTTKALMQKGYIDSASTSANSLLDARQKANDEVPKLEREFKLLDFQAKICALRATTSNPCPTTPTPTAQ